MTDITKSIEQLEKSIWPDTTFPTRLVERCHHYRRIPIKDLSIEQLRTLIGQNIGLPYIIPLALDILTENMLAEGGLYEGDLLNAVLTSDKTFWDTNKSLSQSFKANILEKTKFNTISNISRHLQEQIEIFLKNS